MGRSQLRKREFFKRHPHCCFCGGSALAVEEDHIPARSLFRGRDWPEGYVFPACSTCNDDSAGDELVLAWLVRVHLGECTPQDEEEMTKALVGLKNNRPALLLKMRELSRNQVRRELTARGLTQRDFPDGVVSMVKMPEEMLDVCKRYGEKLGKALYYHHTQRIVPTEGWVDARVAPNVDFMAPTFPWKAFDVLNNTPLLTRSSKSIADQFAYRYALPVDGGGAGFVMQFRESLLLTAMVFEDRAAAELRRAELSGKGIAQ